MLRIPGQLGKDLCDPRLGHDAPRSAARRRLVGAGPQPGRHPASCKARGPTTSATDRRRPRLGQGQEHHHGLPPGRAEPSRPVGPQGQRARQRPQRLQADRHQDCPACNFTEILPKLAQVTDKFTMIRSMSYTPNGLFNHTAAIYQMMTGYTTDKVSPSGQLEPPSPKDFPNFGSNIIRLKPPTVPMLPFVMLPRPLQESNVVGKGGTAGFLGTGLRSVLPLSRRRRHGHDQDGPHQGRRPEAAARGLRRPAASAAPSCATRSTQGMPDDRQGRRQVQPQRVLRHRP